MSKIYDPMLDPDFIGYNCQNPNSTEEFGLIRNKAEFAEEYFLSILESLPKEYKDKATKKNLFNCPKITNKQFLDWSKEVFEFFKINGIRWVFVRENMPVADMDSQFFYVSIPENKILCSFDYSFDDEDVRIVVYISKGKHKFKPKFYNVIDDFDDDIEDEIDEIDTEGIDESDNGDDSYWESAWKGYND